MSHRVWLEYENSGHRGGWNLSWRENTVLEQEKTGDTKETVNSLISGGSRTETRRAEKNVFGSRASPLSKSPDDRALLPLSQGLDPDPLVPRFNEAAWIDLQDVRDCTACFIPLAFYSAARFFRKRILGTSANEKVREICALDIEISSKEQGESSWTDPVLIPG